MVIFHDFFHSDVSLPEGTGAQRRIWGIGWNWMMSSYGLDHSPIPDSLVWDIVRRCEVMTPTFSMPTTWRITSGGLAIPKAREAMAPSRYVALGLHWELNCLTGCPQQHWHDQFWRHLASLSYLMMMMMMMMMIMCIHPCLKMWVLDPSESKVSFGKKIGLW